MYCRREQTTIIRVSPVAVLFGLYFRFMWRERGRTAIGRSPKLSFTSSPAHMLSDTVDVAAPCRPFCLTREPTRPGKSSPPEAQTQRLLDQRRMSFAAKSASWRVTVAYTKSTVSVVIPRGKIQYLGSFSASTSPNDTKACAAAAQMKRSIHQTTGTPGGLPM